MKSSSFIHVVVVVVQPDNYYIHVATKPQKDHNEFINLMTPPTTRRTFDPLTLSSD